MNTEKLRTALRGATVGLETPPSFAGEVVRGGARRVRRRRLLVAGVAAATALAVGGTVIAGWQTVSEPAQVATDPRLNEPTRGDLAADTEFLNDAVRAWQRGLPDERMAGPDAPGRLAGRPHVYWAGTTPAGRAAVVMQAASTQPKEGQETPEVREVLQGLVAIDPATGTEKLVAVYPPVGRDIAYRFGPQGTTVLAIEQNRPQYLSPDVVYGANDHAERTWQPMTPRDGVVIGQVPAGTGAMGPLIVLGDPAQATSEDDAFLISAKGVVDEWAAKQRNGLPWGEPGGSSHMMWAGTQPDGWQDMGKLHQRLIKKLHASPLVDPLRGRTDDPSTWYLSVGLANGATASIGEFQAPYDARARIYVAISGPAESVSYVGPTDSAKPLPVLVKMPDQQGWAAAAKGATLSYRTTVDGTWQGERADALLAPVGTVQIQVTRPGREPVTVDIS